MNHMGLIALASTLALTGLAHDVGEAAEFTGYTSRRKWSNDAAFAQRREDRKLERKRRRDGRRQRKG